MNVAEVLPPVGAGMGKPRCARSRRGSVLIEFAMIAMVSSLLLGAIVSFGLILAKSNVAQQAADVGAQELARMPLNPVNTINPGNDNGYLDDVLYGDPANNPPIQAVRNQIFDEQYLYVPASPGESLYGSGAGSVTANWPLLNRLLVPMMIFDVDRNAFRFPGAVVTNNTTGQITVLVPLLLQRGTQGETIEWHRPVEEIKFPDGNGVNAGQFSIAATSTSTAFSPGVVALRIYCPVQTSMISFQQPQIDSEGGPAPNIHLVNQADDSAVTMNDPLELMQHYSLAPAATSTPGTDSGEFGLGYFLSPLPVMQGSAPGMVRPFSRVVIGQGIYRREVFGP